MENVIALFPPPPPPLPPPPPALLEYSGGFVPSRSWLSTAARWTTSNVFVLLSIPLSCSDAESPGDNTPPDISTHTHTHTHTYKITPSSLTSSKQFCEAKPNKCHWMTSSDPPVHCLHASTTETPSCLTSQPALPFSPAEVYRLCETPSVTVSHHREQCRRRHKR